MKLNIIDVIIILFILVFVLAGFKNGIINEIVSLIGIIAIVVVSFIFKEQIGNILCKYLPFFNFTGELKGLVSLNILFYQLVGFFLVAGILLGVFALILKVSGIFQKLINLTIVLAIPSKIGGALIGVLEGTIITFVIVLALSIPLSDFDYYRESLLVNKMLYDIPVISSKTKNVSSSIKDVYDLVDKVRGRKITVNEANIEIIEDMLKYKIVDVKTIEQLIVLDKLKSVNGIDKVVARYK